MCDKHYVCSAAERRFHQILGKILTSLKIENWFVVGIFNDRMQVKAMIDVHINSSGLSQFLSFISETLVLQGR